VRVVVVTAIVMLGGLSLRAGAGVGPVDAAESGVMRSTSFRMSDR
jgi:hypothetical protein